MSTNVPLKGQHSLSSREPKVSGINSVLPSVMNITEKIVVIMRHGQTDWNCDGRIQGTLDQSQLTDNGVLQAQTAGQSLCSINFDTIFCSPLRRAQDTLHHAKTASLVSPLAKIFPQRIESLKEIQVPWQGLLKSEIPNGVFAEAYANYRRDASHFSYYGFSPIGDLSKRAESVWQTIYRSPGMCQLLVGHNQMNKALICAGLEIPTNLNAWYQNNCCFNVFVIGKNNEPRLRLCNGNEHAGLNNKLKRPRRKEGYIRLFLHRSGNWDGLSHEIAQANISQAYNMKGNTLPTDEPPGLQHVLRKFSTFDLEDCAEGSLYIKVEKFLRTIQQEHNNEEIIILLNSKLQYETFFAACVGLGENATDHLESDPGGVSIVDIPVMEAKFPNFALVQCYNASAFPGFNCLKGYTDQTVE